MPTPSCLSLNLKKVELCSKKLFAITVFLVCLLVLNPSLLDVSGILDTMDPEQIFVESMNPSFIHSEQHMCYTLSALHTLVQT